MAKTSVLKPILKELGLSIHKFEIESNIPRGRISKGLDSDTALSADTITKIVERFPHINKDYLLYGKGDMFIKSPNAGREVPDSFGHTEEDINAFAAGDFHEGDMIREWAKGKNYSLAWIAGKLDMTPQALNANLRPLKIREDFRRLLEEKLQVNAYSEIFHYSPEGDAKPELVRIKQKVYSSNINDLLIELFAEIEYLKNKSS